MKTFYTAILFLSLASLMAGTSCRNDEVGKAPLTERISSTKGESLTLSDDERYKILFGPSEERKPTPGFEGGYYNHEGTAGLIVLNNTITYATSGRWMATGLLRNETGKSIAYPTITAILFDKAQRELGKETYRSPLPLIFQGEPIPFIVNSQVLASQVDSVRWEVTSSQPRLTVDTRNMNFGTFRSEPYGDVKDIPRAFLSPMHTRGYVALGYLTNSSKTKRLYNPIVVAAWMDESNEHVLWVAQVEPEWLNPDAAKEKLLGSGESEDFMFVVNDPTIAPKLLDFRGNHLLWGASY